MQCIFIYLLTYPSSHSFIKQTFDAHTVPHTMLDTKNKKLKKKKGKLSISPIPVNVVGHFGFCIKVTKYSVKIILQASPYPWYKDSSMSNQTLKNGLKKKIYK